jgi:hypothetical protein
VQRLPRRYLAALGLFLRRRSARASGLIDGVPAVVAGLTDGVPAEAAGSTDGGLLAAVGSIGGKQCRRIYWVFQKNDQALGRNRPRADKLCAAAKTDEE